MDTAVPQHATPGDDTQGRTSVPPDFSCAQCGYPSGRSGSVVCPECGWAATTAELLARETRREIVRRWASEPSRVRRWMTVACCYSLGGAVISKSVLAGVGALAALGVAIPVSVWIGGRWQARLHAERRDYLRVVWHRLLWILHLPWLVAPMFVMVALIVGLIDRWAADPSGEAYSQVVLAGFFCWCIFSVGSYLAWWLERLRAIRIGGYRRLGWADAWAALAGLAVSAGASGLGFGAGLVTAFGISDWLGLSAFLGE